MLRVYTAAAEQVRSDSQFQSKLTSAAALLELSGIDPEPQLIASKMAETSGCDDVKMIFAVNGHAYFYSEHWFSRKDAERLVLGEEVRSQIADHVRQDSMTKAKLTSVDRLGMLIPGAEPDKIEGHLALLLDDARYSDVKLISNSKGTKYLYCAYHMTATYAMVLSRAEANDPIGTIAATVRDESRIYPRPTRLGMFSAPVFNIDPSRIETYAREIVKDPAYPDIKLAEASNGALYLYSDLYVDARWVRSTIEWEEVEQFSNP
jgi:hypothetical protein